jgi:Ca2+-binding RTX toxin-like protein
LSGGPGKDVVDGAAGADTISGGAGDDIFLTYNRPAGKDVVSCGGGHDEVFADRADVVSGDCERVHLP